ncbi:hypothetical protein Cgig2_019013 [Carnegiea gigantea]|uniref:F-box domain-containing protein n=1 Tax=Carnegiea gigantea TaxID=171969 RepID=A0A9Q1GX61_9CARY|nr:hypothetical protein Cgig2_019013 [Carnegiea gigantea]
MDTMTRQKVPSHRPVEIEATLPDDIVEVILSQLSVRQLLRFRCVSKSGCALIDSLRFIKKQHEKQYSIFKEEGNMPLVLDSGRSVAINGDPSQFYLLSKGSEDVPLCVTSDLERDSTPYSPMNLGRFKTLRLSGFVNGVALLVWEYRGDQNSYFALWNPATREFKVVSPRRPRSHRKRQAMDPPHAYLILSFDFSDEVLKVHDPPIALDNTQYCEVVKYMDSLVFVKL